MNLLWSRITRALLKAHEQCSRFFPVYSVWWLPILTGALPCRSAKLARFKQSFTSWQQFKNISLQKIIFWKPFWHIILHFIISTRNLLSAPLFVAISERRFHDKRSKHYHKLCVAESSPIIYQQCLAAMPGRETAAECRSILCMPSIDRRFGRQHLCGLYASTGILLLAFELRTLPRLYLPFQNAFKPGRVYLLKRVVPNTWCQMRALRWTQ